MMAAIRTDRVGELIEGVKHNRRVIISPEGVPLDIQVAGNWERLAAFILDLVFMLAAIIIITLVIPLLIFDISSSIGWTIALFLTFVVRVFYFMYFELAWQGRTPGKKICGLRIINRKGGELKPAAIIARNLTREIEFFWPWSLFLRLGSEASILQDLALLVWMLVLTSLPLFNRDHLRAGDLIGGTQVIAMPQRVLLKDLAETSQKNTSAIYTFTPDQLAIYGTFELQVLEEFLRRPDNKVKQQLLAGVCQKICHRIGWEEEIPPENIQSFLRDFYTAERADLERGQLFGRFKADKRSSTTQKS